MEEVDGRPASQSLMTVISPASPPPTTVNLAAIARVAPRGVCGVTYSPAARANEIQCRGKSGA
jgi:hypothetical protein